MHKKTAPTRPAYQVEEVDEESQSPQQQNADMNQDVKQTASVNVPTSAQHDFHFTAEPKRKPPFWIIAAVLGIIIIIFLVWKLLVSSNSADSEPPTVADILIESSPDQNASSAAVNQQKPPAKDLDRTDYNVQVLNGSGIVGAAGKLAKVLQTAGFEDVDIGNADKFDADGVLIKVKDEQLAIGELIKTDLASAYQGIKIKESLDTDSDFDVVIILGSQPSDALNQSTDKTATGSAGP